MARIHVDLEQMRSFANALEKSRSRVSERRRGIEAMFTKLHDSWRDKKYEQFSSVFREAMRGLAEFDKLASDYSRALKAKADKGTAYLR